MKGKQFLALVFAGAMLMLGAVGCGNGNKTSSAKTNQNEIAIAVSSEPKNGFDPTTGWGHSAATIFHSLLFRRDNKMDIVGDVGTKYKLSEDRLTWTIEIRDDVKFSDGSALTADDVVYSYNTARNNPDSNVDLTMIDGITKVNDTTIDFKLTSPQSTFIDKLMEIGLVPKAIHEKGAQAYSEKPIGSGPYIMKQWDKGQQVICEGNDMYYGKQPQFEKLTLVYLKEDSVMTALQSGTVDMAKVTYSNADTKIDGYKLKEVTSVENQGICFPIPKAGETYDTPKRANVPYGNDVTSDVAIRKAINLGVDREAMIEGLLNGHGTPAYTGYEQMPWNDESLAFEDGDVEGAKKILEDAGWVMGSDGIREKDGVKAEFKVLYWPNSESRQQLAVYLSEYCKQHLGINIIPTQIEESEFVYAMHSDPGVLSWGEHSPQLMYQLMGSKFVGDSWNNAGFYKNATVDAYMETALNAATEEEANENWKKAEYDATTGFAYQGDAAWVWFMNTNHLYIMQDGLNIGDPKPQPHGGAILDNITEWTFQ